MALRAPPAFSSRPPWQPPGNQCDPTSYSAAFPPCVRLCGAINLAWFPCLWCSVSPNSYAHDYSRRGRSVTGLSDTGRTDAHNASLVPLLTLSHGQAGTSSPFSRLFVVGPLVPPVLPIALDAPRDCKKSLTTGNVRRWVLSFSHRQHVHQQRTDGSSLSLFLTFPLSFSLSVTLLHSYSLALCRVVSTNDRRWILSLSLSHSRTFSHSFSLACFLTLSFSCSLALSLSRSLSCRVHKRPTMDSLSLSLTRSLAFSLSRSLALSLS